MEAKELLNELTERNKNLNVLDLQVGCDSYQLLGFLDGRQVKMDGTFRPPMAANVLAAVISQFLQQKS